MKKILLLLMLPLFIACGDDDDNRGKHVDLNSQIVGHWKSVIYNDFTGREHFLFTDKFETDQFYIKEWWSGIERDTGSYNYRKIPYEIDKTGIYVYRYSNKNVSFYYKVVNEDTIYIKNALSSNKEFTEKEKFYRLK